MMIICFDCSPETKRYLDFLLDSGQYNDYSEALSFAVMNLAVLQEEINKTGSVVIGSSAELASLPYEVAVPSKQTSAIADRGKTIENPSPTTPSLGVPDIFRRDLLRDTAPPVVDLPDDIWAFGQEIPLDRWIFGQYNKLLPAKVSCRALAHLLISEPKGIVLEEAAQEIARKAAVLGDFLAHLDATNNIARDDALSTAFPSTGENSDKSRLRYANQFVASVNKEGQISGLLIDLKLINRSGQKATRLMLTETGWQLANMPNPILDGVQDTPIQKFSEDERDFLLNHIAQRVPVEDFAYRAILIAITEGANTPDTIDNSLLKYVPQDTERSLSTSFRSSQRSGAISRMTDLGLVERVREGVRVSYIVTDTGEKYVRNAR
jgi:hypothetical protein